MRLLDGRPFKLNKRVAPVAQSALAQVFPAYIHASDEGGGTVHHHQFPVVAEVQPQDVAQEMALPVERFNVHSCFPQGGNVTGGELVGADFIIQHVNADAGPGPFNQQLLQVLPHGVVFDDEEFNQDVMLRVLDGVVDARESIGRVNKQAAGIAAADGQPHDIGKRVHDFSRRVG